MLTVVEFSVICVGDVFSKIGKKCNYRFPRPGTSDVIKCVNFYCFTLSIVNRGEWLGRAARPFEVGYCSPFWVVT